MQSTSTHMHKSTQADVLTLGCLKQGEIDSVFLSWCVPKQQGYFWKTFAFLHHLYLPVAYYSWLWSRLFQLKKIMDRFKKTAF